MKAKELPTFLVNLLKLKEKLKEDQKLEKAIKPFKIILNSQKRQLENNRNLTEEEREKIKEEIKFLKTFLRKMEK